ncbi:general substrate transporter [Lipomyces doorenjongii]
MSTGTAQVAESISIKPEAFIVEDTHEGIYQRSSIEHKFGGLYIWLVTFSAAVGGFLFGYDLTVISGVLALLGSDLGHELSTGEQELVTSMASAGAFVGVVIAGLLLDKYGRRKAVACGAVIFVIGSLVQAVSYSVVQMTIGRFIVGLGIGQASMVAPVYIAELSPAALRGRMVTIDSLALTGAQCVGIGLSIAFQHTKHGWRYSIGLGAAPALLLMSLCFFIPETPRFLIMKDRLDTAAEVIGKIYPKASRQEVIDKVHDIRLQLVKELGHQQLSLKQSFKMLYFEPSNLRALVVACGIVAINQFAGTNAFLYYAPKLFSIVGFDDALTVSIVVSGTNFVFGFIPLKYIDTFGRRRLLLWTMWGLPISLMIGAIAMHYIPISSDLVVKTEGITWAGVLVLVCVICFTASFASCLGTAIWQVNELFPLEVRSLGAMMGVCTCWGSNIIVSSTYLSMMKGITPAGTFGFYSALMAVAYACVYFFYPEVSLLTLEDIKAIFKDGFGVKESERIAKERRKLKNVDVVSWDAC